MVRLPERLLRKTFPRIPVASRNAIFCSADNHLVLAPPTTRPIPWK